MTNNPAYPTPPIDMPGFKTAIDAYAAAIAGALDGGKAAFATRDKRRGDMILMLRQLGHYVEIACKEDMETLLIEWFRGRVSRRGPEQPLRCNSDRFGQSRHHWPACGDDQKRPESPAL